MQVRSWAPRFRCPASSPRAFRRSRLRDGPSPPPIDVRLDPGVAAHLRIRDGDGKPVASRWIEVNFRRLQTDVGGEVDVWGFRAGDPIAGDVSAIGDRDYTHVEMRAEHAPATIDLVLRRRGSVGVTLPITWRARRGELVFTVRRSDGSIANEDRVPAGTFGDSDRPVYRIVPVFESGDVRIEARCDNGNWSAPASVALGRTVMADLSAR